VESKETMFGYVRRMFEQKVNMFSRKKMDGVHTCVGRKTGNRPNALLSICLTFPFAEELTQTTRFLSEVEGNFRSRMYGLKLSEWEFL
jgi:hypothetical protein